MGKKKSIQPANIENTIIKEFGDNILVSGQSIIDTQDLIIPVSPKLDIILGGGIPEGSFVITTGPPKCGKTISALDFAATAQQPQYKCDIGRPEGRHIYYFNIEGRIKGRDLKGIHHLNISKERFTVIKSTLGNILTAEMNIDIAEKLINACPGDVFIIDSFSALCTKGRFDSNIEGRYRDDTPLLLANFCKRISNVIATNKIIFIGITHIIANQGQGYTKWTEASGRKIQYQADVKLKCTHFSPWETRDTQIGQDVHWICETSALGPPGGKCTSKLRYNYGLDKEAEIIELATDLGIIKKSGAWLSYNNKNLGQGIEKTKDFLLNNQDLYHKLYTQVKEMCV